MLCHGDHMARRAMDQLMESLIPAPIEARRPGGCADFSLHVDADAICPRCLHWIDPDEYVRRNALGLVQHETCPEVGPRPLRAAG